MSLLKPNQRPTRLLELTKLSTVSAVFYDEDEAVAAQSGSPRISYAQKRVIGILRLLLPPHVDNERAADYLRIKIGQNDRAIEWTAVRSDNSIKAREVTAYEVHASPPRSATFDAGVTRPITVDHVIADLITADDIWNRWKGQMPVIYNKTLPHVGTKS